jgi:hypothetical protein
MLVHIPAPWFAYGYAIDDQGIPRQIEPGKSGRLKMAQVKADVQFLICKVPTGNLT